MNSTHHITINYQDYQFTPKFNSYVIHPQVSSASEPFVPPIGKINNHFMISYELNNYYLIK